MRPLSLLASCWLPLSLSQSLFPSLSRFAWLRFWAEFMTGFGREQRDTFSGIFYFVFWRCDADARDLVLN